MLEMKQIGHLTPQQMMKRYNVDDICAANIDKLLSMFELKYIKTRTRITLPCPVHGGDNPGGCTIFLDEPTNWKCWTHHCEDGKKSLTSLFKTLLEKKIKKKLSYSDFYTWATSVLGTSPKSVIGNEFCNISELLRTKQKTYDFGLPIDRIKDKKSIVSEFMLNKGYSLEVLTKYDVFDCNNQHKQMFDRAVVPIYDESQQFMIGCLGRSIHPKCDICKFHHSKEKRCPETPYQKSLLSKWKNSKGLSTDSVLYNIWFAKKHIEETGTVIIVESCGNVWKLEQNKIHNSLGIFGSDIKAGQMEILESLPINNLVLIFDNDDAGKLATEKAIKKLHRLYNIIIPKIDYEDKNDISELPNEKLFFLRDFCKPS
jgi:5S rRNA maturation endonuclease (ribonuclease M5)